MESYRYLLIEESLFTIMSLSAKEVTDEIVKYLKKNANNDLQASYNVFKIAERLAWLQQYFTLNKNVYSNSLIKFIVSKLKPMLLSLDEPTIYRNYLSEHIQSSPEEFAKEHELFISKILAGNISEFYQTHSPSLDQPEPLSFLAQAPQHGEREVAKVRDEGQLRNVLRDIFRREKKDFNNEDERINYNLQQLISSLKLSAQIQGFMSTEYLEKVDSYYKRKNRYKFIRRIIALNSRNPTALSHPQKIFFLQYIIGFIEACN